MEAFVIVLTDAIVAAIGSMGPDGLRSVSQSVV